MEYFKVYCPSCGGNVGSCSAKGILYHNRCKVCRKIVVVNPATRESKIIKQPTRLSSGATTFY